VLDDESSVRKTGERCRMVALCASVVREPLHVELRIHRVGTHLHGMTLTPERREADVVLAPAQRAWAMAGSEGRRLVEKEELRELAGLEERFAMPAAKLEPARDPAAAGVPAPDTSGVVV
jgi:hypothetical protein